MSNSGYGFKNGGDGGGAPLGFAPQSGPGYPPPNSGGAPYPPQGSPYPPPSSGAPPYPPTYGGSGYQPQQPGGYMPPGYQPPPIVQQPSAGNYGGGPPGPPQHQNHPPAFGSGMQPPPGYGGPPITSQPTADADGWMNIPQGIPNCPRGLEYLTYIDQLLVKQKIELLEAITGFETNNKFTIKNSLGQKVYWAQESNDCLTRNCCGPARPFDMKIFDIYRNEVIHLSRPLRCSLCCFPCCLQTIEISSPPGNIIGRVEQEWSLCTPEFSIYDESGRKVLRISGPVCTMSICGDVNFEILTLEGVQVGRISKQWSGMLREMFVDADYFGITFPMDLDVKMKAVMLGACFLIDAMYFEKTNNN